MRGTSSILPELVSGRGTKTRSGLVEGLPLAAVAPPPLHHRLRRSWREIMSPGHDLGQPGAGQSANSPSPSELGEDL
jgi:hypothetical protein